MNQGRSKEKLNIAEKIIFNISIAMMLVGVSMIVTNVLTYFFKLFGYGC